MADIFKIVIHEAEEGGFWGEIPMLPGCATQGETIPELLNSLQEAVEGWLLSVPQNC
jgi:predicted RNase H-like HicB family nuclease